MSNEQIIQELKNIKAILAFSNSKLIEDKLNTIIRTKARKLLWIHCDGKKTQTDLANLVDVSQPAVSVFVNLTQKAGLMDNSPSGCPYRVLDYIPSTWLELLEDKNLLNEEIKKEGNTLDEYR